jgi:hypothetical protein
LLYFFFSLSKILFSIACLIISVAFLFLQHCSFFSSCTLAPLQLITETNHICLPMPAVLL